MWPHPWLILALSSVIEREVSGLVGLEFSDNFSQDYITEQNGIAVARTQVKHTIEEDRFDRSTISLGYKSVNLLCLDLPQLE